MRRFVLSAVLALGSMMMWSPAATAVNRITTVDTDAVFAETSVVLDAAGRPVVSYHDSATEDLQLVHCNDVDCAGGDERIVTVDSTDAVGSSSSLLLDAAGNPVISYYDETNGHLKVAHCNDPECTGGDESVVAVDRSGTAGAFSSLALDAAGNPVVSYHDYGNFDLKLVHCNDPNCAGGDESTLTVDSAGDVGSDTSLELDAAGNPVIAAYDFGNADLKLVHCSDPDCAGGDERIVTVDEAGDVGAGATLDLDSAANPVIGYFDRSNRDLKLVHCNDPSCAGGDESIVTVDEAGDVGTDASLALDATGNPVVSYRDMTNGDLKVAHCTDVDCAGGDQTTFAVDSDGDVGLDTSLALDSRGNPVVSYRDGASEDLKLAHCDNPLCSPATCIGFGATIMGTDGHDMINGTGGADVIVAGPGDDTINGLAGDDVVCGGDDRDTVNGGDGNDVLRGFSDDDERRDLGDTIRGDVGDDFIDGGPGDDVLDGGEGNDHVLGGETDSDDVLAGGPGDDELFAEGGVDTVSFADSGAGVSANLATETATGEGADVVSGFENMVGSAFGDTLVGDGGVNTIQGLAGDDVLDGAAGNDTVSYAAAGLNVSVSLETGIASGDGTDVLAGFENLTGSTFGDNLVGDRGANTIKGLDGTDAIDGTAGADRVEGSDGDDVIFGSAGNDVFNGGAGSDTLNFTRSSTGVDASLSSGRVSGEGSDRIAGIEHLGGTEFADRLTGNAGRNSIAGGRGNDVIVGGGGADAAYGDEGTDRIDGGSGDDLLVGGAGADTIQGGSGADSLWGSIEDGHPVADSGDRIDGGGGNDVIDAGIGNDVVAGGPGDDHLSGEAGVDTVTFADAAARVSVSLRAKRAAGDGSDLLFGLENVIGSRFADVLVGDDGANVIRAGGGGDSLVGRGGNDALDGGLGIDTVSFAASADGVRVNLARGTAAGDGADRLLRSDNLIGSRFGDVLTGNAFTNTIRGGAGADRLLGGAGKDGLDCGLGVDRANGGSGADTQRRCEVVVEVP